MLLQRPTEKLDPSHFSLPISALELPSKRTLRTATFDLGSGKRAQVGVDSKLFTHAANGSVVFASDQGEVREHQFVFERLAQDTQVAFDLNRPAYTLATSGHAIEFSFPTDHPIAGTVLDAHSIAYQLTPSARLVWTVEGNTVTKAIHVTKDGTKPDLSFILSSPSLTQTLSGNRITFTEPSTQKVVLQTQAPFFTTTNGDPLLVAVTITKTASGSFYYSYDDDQLPSEYILDPSAGPNNPANAESDTSNGGNSWIYDLLDVLSLDGNKVFCQASLAECSRLKLYNFGFAIPDTATIDGVEVNIYGTAPSSESMSVTMMKLLNDSRAPVGTNKATNGAWPGGSDGYGNKTLTLGGTTDTWGVTLTPAIVNDADFGFVYSQQDLSGMGATAQIDSVNITVYYTASGDSADGGGEVPGGNGLAPFILELRRRALHRDTLQSVPTVPIQGVLFIDDRPNAIRDRDERTGFAGLPLTLSGTVADTGRSVSFTTQVSATGSFAMNVPPGEYSFQIDSLSPEFQGFETDSASQRVSISVDSTQTVTHDIPVRRTSVAPNPYPCLHFVTSGLASKPTDSIEMEAAKHLVNPFSEPVLQGVALTERLVSRENFLRLLLSFHCIELATSEAELTSRLSVDSMKPVILRDVPLLPWNRKAQLVYTAIAERLPVARLVRDIPYADLGAPITQSEAQTLITAIRADKAHRDNSATIRRSSRGLTPSEAVGLLLQSSFAGGHISLLRTEEDTTVDPLIAALTKTLSPPIAVNSCFSSLSTRRSTLLIRDVLPSDSLASALAALLPLRALNDQGRPLYLIPGTKRPTEFGVEAGQATVSPNAPISLLELLRSLEILMCNPPESRERMQAMLARRTFSAQGVPVSESGMILNDIVERVATDAFSELPRDASFPSRVMYHAQDRIRAFHLTLTSFSSDRLPQSRPPMAGLSIAEATNLFTSAYFGALVRSGVIDATAAQGRSSSVADTLIQDLGYTQLTARTEPFTRRMLLHVLNAALRQYSMPSEIRPSIAELWMERVMSTTKSVR